MKVPHPKVASGDDSKVTPEEKQALYDAYVAYFGTYRVDREKGSLTFTGHYQPVGNPSSMAFVDLT